MILKEYLKKYRITVEEFAVRSNLSSATLWHYFSGRRSPTQKTAERIEKVSDGLVTVTEQRGTDKRIKKSTDTGIETENTLLISENPQVPNINKHQREIDPIKKIKKVNGISEPIKLSRTKIELFCECPRCFILDRKFGITRPSGPPFTLNNAIDALWKKEFDRYRVDQKPHPTLLQYGLNIIPFQHESIDDWRNNRRGVQSLHETTQFVVYGAPDEICINEDGELIVVDVKATSKTSEINLDAEWQISYKRQMEIYQWLLRQNGFKVSRRGYFVYCNGKKNEDSSGCSLAFDIYVLPYDADDSWIESKILEIKKVMDADLIPDSSPGCKYCRYCQTASQALSSNSQKINV